MIGSWLRVFGRKLVGHRYLHKGRCPMRWWAIRPCLEALEVRTLLSTAMLEPPTLAVRAAAFPISAVPVAQPPDDAGNAGNATDTGADAIALDEGGIARLLDNLRAFTAGLQPTAPLGSDASIFDPALPIPGLPPSLHDVVATNSSPDVVDTPTAAVVAAPPNRPPDAPVSHPGANSSSEVIQGPAQSTTTLPSITAPNELPVAAMHLPIPSALGAVGLASSWTPPTALPNADANNLLPVAEADAAYSGWLNPASAAPPVQLAEAPTDSVWSVPDATPPGPAPARCDAAEAVAVHTGVSALPAALADGALLERFVTQRDQTAFTALVARHARLVWRICRRVLGDVQAAEDAFQAAFVVLARKAGALDPHRPLSGWLYLVAYHLALRLRAVAARRRRSETQAAGNRAVAQENEAAAELENAEIHQALREEVQRLPEKYRAPLVLCYFQGQTHTEAARTIGMPRGSIAKRIGEGLEQLRQRLTDRGISL